jgi:hypothetical protein
MVKFHNNIIQPSYNARQPLDETRTILRKKMQALTEINLGAY